MGTTLVLGATGTVGRIVAAELAAAGESVRGASRDPARAEAECTADVEWVAFDWTKPETFRPAVEHAERVFMISRPGDEDAALLAMPFVSEMEAVGVRHVVYLSAMGAEERPSFSTRQVELALEASGIPFTHLRPNFFMQIHSSGLLGLQIRTTRQVGLPAGDAKLSLVDARDVAAVAARVLVEGGGHKGRAYTLTGPAAIDYEAVAAHIGQASGSDVRYVSLDEATAAKMLEQAGVAEPQVERLLGMYRLVRAGACEPVTQDVEQILGRPGISFDVFATDHADGWR